MQTTKLYELKKIQSEFPKLKIKHSSEAAEFIRQFYGDDLEIFESFFILLLDKGNNTIGYAKISQGGICSTTIDKKILCKYVVDSLASGVILAHNHPSGTLTPSEPDQRLTRELNECIKLFDSVILDHVILTADNYFSFSDSGYI